MRSEPAPAIETEDLSVDLGGARRLDAVSLRVAAGTFHGLLGPNGAGKSTLLRVLYRSQAPQAGRARVQGRDIARIPRAEWIRTLGALVQDGGALQGLSVRDVVEIGLMGLPLAPDLKARRIAEALEVAGLSALADAQAALVSGGERQKTFIAQLLARDPEIYILDEPANHLDLRYQYLLLDAIRDRGRTVLATFHDIALAARYCDAVTVLDRGKAVVSGPPQAVLTPEILREVFGIDARLEEGNLWVSGPRRG